MKKGEGIETCEYSIAFWPVQSTEWTGTSSKATFACLGLISSFLYLLSKEEICGPQQNSFIQEKKMLMCDHLASQQNTDSAISLSFP